MGTMTIDEYHRSKHTRAMLHFADDLGGCRTAGRHPELKVPPNSGSNLLRRRFDENPSLKLWPTTSSVSLRTDQYLNAVLGHHDQVLRALPFLPNELNGYGQGKDIVATPLQQFGAEMQNPTMRYRMIQRDAALRHHLLQIA